MSRRCGKKARRLGALGSWLLQRFSEGSSQAAIAAAIVNFSLTAPPASWICLALGFGQVLLPDGWNGFGPRRRRAAASTIEGEKR